MIRNRLKQGYLMATQVLMLTIISLAVTSLISSLSNSEAFQFVFPESAAVGDFDYTDYAFKDKRSTEISDKIVLVNVGSLDRRGIAQMLNIISKYRPKVVGLDTFFDCRGLAHDTISCPALSDALGNQMLSDAIRNAGNVVMISKLLKMDSTIGEGNFDSLRISDPAFQKYARAHGYANLSAVPAFQEHATTCRTFVPKYVFKERNLYAFSVEMARMFDAGKASMFLERQRKSEFINFGGNVLDIVGVSKYPNRFFVLDVSDIQAENFVPESMNDKIVILGYMGNYLGDASWPDKFYTPLNKNMFGKSNPDMFGVVVHANIVQMIIDQSWVNTMGKFGELLFALLATIAHISILVWTLRQFPGWYDIVSLMVVVVQLVFYAYLRLYSFELFNYKIELLLTLGCLAVASFVVSIFHVHAKWLSDVLFGIRFSKV